MSDKHDTPASLLAREAQGGDIALGGFGFQEGMILRRIPGWLRNDGFTSLIWEANGDAEARFFAPQGEQITLCEFKDHRLTPAPFWEEISRFEELSSEVPAYHRFELVCRGLSDDLISLVRQLNRLRGAFPFYEVAPVVQDQSFRALQERIQASNGNPEIARFLFDHVFIEGDAPDGEGQAQNLFREALEIGYPMTARATGGDIAASFEATRSLLVASRASNLTRSRIAAAVWNSIPDEARPADDRVCVHTEHEDTRRVSNDHAVLLPWKRFYGGPERSFPPSPEWESLVADVESLRRWVVETERPRVIDLSGQRRLSQSVALGATLSAVAGFTLRGVFRNVSWQTSDESTTDSGFPWKQRFSDQRPSPEIAVSIGVPRSIRTDVDAHLVTHGSIPHLSLEFLSALESDREASAAVGAAKAAIAEKLQQVGAARIHLFLSVPSPFALFLGHRLNALGTVCCYEFVRAAGYTPTCTLRVG